MALALHNKTCMHMVMAMNALHMHWQLHLSSRQISGDQWSLVLTEPAMLSQMC